jgi:hypothetical protein
MNKSSVITARFNLYNGYKRKRLWYRPSGRAGKLLSGIARTMKATSIPSTLRFAMKLANTF